MNFNGKTESEAKEALAALVTSCRQACHRPNKWQNGMDFPTFFPALTDAEQTACSEFAPGHASAATLEKALADRQRIDHVHVTPNGLSANLLALSALTSPLLGERSLRPGDEIITAASDSAAVVAPILQLGAVPVLTDVALPHDHIDVTLLERALSPNTRAVMFSHTLGYPFDLKTVRNFCNEYELWLIEDSREALGASYDFDGTCYATGTVGDIGIGSLAPLSPDGQSCGAVYTRDGTLSALIRNLRDGLTKPAEVPSWGAYDHAPSAAQIAADTARLALLTDVIEARRRAVAYLSEALCPVAHLLSQPETASNAYPVPLSLPLICREGIDPAALEAHLARRGIPCRRLQNVAGEPAVMRLLQAGGCRIADGLSVTHHLAERAVVPLLPLGVSEDITAHLAASVIEALR